MSRGFVPLYDARVEEVLAGATEFTAECVGCARKAVVPAELLATLDPNERIRHLAKRLRCTVCGRRGMAIGGVRPTDSTRPDTAPISES